MLRYPSSSPRRTRTTKKPAAATRSAPRITNGAAVDTSAPSSRKSAAKMRMAALVRHQDARHRLVLGVAAGVVVFFAARESLRLWSATIAAWNTFAGVILLLDWRIIWTTPQRKIR